MKRIAILGFALPALTHAAAGEGTPEGADSGLKTITIQGEAFEVTQPYAAGHVATEAEAKALNQVRAENIRNNMAAKIKAALKAAGKTTQADEEGNEVEMQNPLSDEALGELVAAVAEYDASYEFTLASVGGGRASRDPVEIEATKIAKASIVAQLRSKGRTLKSVTHDENGNEIEGGAERLAEAIAKVAAREDVVKAAKKAVADRNKLASADIDELAL